MQEKIKAVIMRGGTSKALFFHKNHLPRDPLLRDSIILSAFGSPDPFRRQIDGLGGAVSSTSKVAIISPSKDPRYDVIYFFGQVSIDRPIVDYRGNCGNISAAVGPFVIDEGLVSAEEPLTRVRIHQKNTDRLIVAEVPVLNGSYREEGDFAIDGVPGTGGKITLHFMDPGGAITGKLLPTGKPQETMKIPGMGSIPVSIVDATHPTVYLKAKDLGLKGAEIGEIEGNEELMGRLERIRAEAAVWIGTAQTAEEASAKVQTVPRIAIVAPPMDYRAIDGREISAREIDLTARILSMGTLHRAFAATGAVCTAVAAKIEGTLVHEALRGEALDRTDIFLGHPSGIMAVGALVERRGREFFCREAITYRTARRLMEGYVYVRRRSQD
jgi:2-methylaconitate cis-trans-isomerase PrpF